MKPLMDYLPPLYQNSGEVRTFQEAWQPEIDMVWEAREDLKSQLNPHTATWGLALWEEAYGLTSDGSLSLDVRRNRVVARIRGMGTTTVEKLKSVVEAFCPGADVTIVEHYGQYLVEISMTLTASGMEDSSGLRDELRLIMPAHLAWGYAITQQTAVGVCVGVHSESGGVVHVHAAAEEE